MRYHTAEYLIPTAAATFLIAWAGVLAPIAYPNSLAPLAPALCILSILLLALAGAFYILEDNRIKAPDAWAAACVFTAAALVFLPRLAGGSLEVWDESWYGEISREMLRSGDYLTPRYMGQPYVDKPPLYMWLTCLNFLLFGETVFSIRLWAGLFSCGTCTALFLLLRRMGRPVAGCLAALIYMQLPLVRLIGGMGTLDSGLNLLITLMFWAAWKSLKQDKLSLWLGLLFGLAAMLKGAAIVFPALVFCLIFLLFGKAKWLHSRQFYLALAIVIVVAGPWHLYIFVTQREEFLARYVRFGVFQRAFTDYHQKTGTVYYYLTTLARKEFFGYWRWLFPAALLAHLPFSLSRARTPEGFFTIGTLGFLIPLSLVATKNFWYVMPVLPPLVLSVGWALTELFSVQGIRAKVLLPVGCYLILVDFMAAKVDGGWASVILSVLLAALGISSYFFGVTRPRVRKGSLVLLIALVILLSMQPAKPLDFTPQRMEDCRKVVQLAKGRVLISWGGFDPCDTFYLSAHPDIRYLVHAEDMLSVLAAIPGEKKILIVITQHSWRSFPQYRELADLQALQERYSLHSLLVLEPSGNQQSPP